MFKHISLKLLLLAAVIGGVFGFAVAPMVSDLAKLPVPTRLDSIIVSAIAMFIVIAAATLGRLAGAPRASLVEPPRPDGSKKAARIHDGTAWAVRAFGEGHVSYTTEFVEAGNGVKATDVGKLRIVVTAVGLTKKQFNAPQGSLVARLKAVGNKGDIKWGDPKNLGGATQNDSTNSRRTISGVVQGSASLTALRDALDEIIGVGPSSAR